MNLNTESAELTCLENGIIFWEILPKKNLDIEDAQKIIAFLKARGQAQNNEKLRVLVDLRAFRGIEKDAKAYVRKELNPLVGAGVAIVKNGISAIAGNLALSFSKAEYSRKLFRDKDKAIAWLLEQEVGKM